MTLCPFAWYSFRLKSWRCEERRVLCPYPFERYHCPSLPMLEMKLIDACYWLTRRLWRRIRRRLREG